ncbi:HAMP domain-containing histidine kinase [Desulfurispirillum indicum]|uniref:histidine kinase n=1 Tax=Desulfurispirillum indicum (strain ATCC BAA-1389 / DSM 22839 / S5) TaxID=653733 RepID=E6W0B4_DESIS|nr:HAMP domain-containing sensor histidine kinase [Desulfurispirillum indicum]ADU66332.1 ATP-binding region ATPase domain protein [Desulfurispirillum indicum S5]UCZ55666.1 HAMP domain-containing histidine kinase [Desulfurispirillum indicum]
MAQELNQLEDASIVKELQRRLNEKSASLLEMEQMTRRLLSLNEQIRHTETIKSEFISLIKTEFRTPISSLLQESQQLVENIGNTDVVATGSHLHQQLLRIDFHMKNIFAAAELEAGETRNAYVKVRLESLIEDALAILQYVVKQKQLRIESTIDLPEGTLVTDAGKMQLVLMNLLSNACEYSYGGDTIRIRGTVEGDRILVSVEDPGEGIPEEHLEHIFQKFYQYHSGKTRLQKGLGLGLNVARGLVDLLGGSVHCTSAPGGKSTVFTVSLPLKDDREVKDTSDGGNDFMFEAF